MRLPVARALLLALPFALGSLAAPRALAEEAARDFHAPPDEHCVDAARLAGWPEPATPSLAAGAKDIRLWSFGVIQRRVVRLQVDAAGAVKGEALVYFRKPRNANDVTDLRHELMAACAQIRESTLGMLCIPAAQPHEDWAALYRELMALGLWTLPDESTLPRPSVPILDGSAVTAELADPGSYRWFYYANPWDRQPERVAASKIIRRLGAIETGHDLPR